MSDKISGLLVFLALLIMMSCHKELPTQSRSKVVHDSLETVLDKDFGINQITKNGTILNAGINHNSVLDVPAPSCYGNGNYRGYIPTIESGFTFTFGITNGVMMQFALILSGFSTYTWTTGQTYMTGSMSGVTYGTADYSIGSYHYTYLFQVRFSFDQSNCLFTYQFRDITNNNL